MSTPKRPAGVPAEARYDAASDPDYRWVVGELDTDGKEHGFQRTYADAGYVHAEAMYDHGEVTGTNTVFHPDGSIASTGAWQAGRIYDSIFHRARIASPEPFPADVGDNVVEVRYCATDDGRSNACVLYFDAAGHEVTDTGAAMPPRPAGIDAEARWFPTRKLWMKGAVMRGPRPASIGTVKHWAADGTLRRHDEHGADGVLQSSRLYDERGQLSRLEDHEDGVLRKRERYHANGALKLHETRRADERPLLVARYDEHGQTRELERTTYDGDTIIAYHEEDDTGPTYTVTGDGTRYRAQLFQAGRVLADGDIVDGRLSGSWQIYGDDGQVRTQVAPTGAAQVESVDNHSAVHRAMCEALLHAEPARALPGVEALDANPPEGPYGPVGELPLLLRGLASSEPVVRDYAAGRLMMNIEHQGSVYPATLAVVPYLIQLLELDTVDREALLDMLRDVAVAAQRLLQQIDDDDDDDEPDDGIGRDLLQRIGDAVGAGWPILVRRLEHGSPREQARVIQLAGVARRPDLEADMLRLARDAATPAIRARAVEAISAMGASDDVASFLTDPEPAVRMTAAISVALELGPDAPDATDGVLAELLASLSNPQLIADLPLRDTAPLSYLALAVGARRSKPCFALGAPILHQIDQVSALSAVEVGRGLLGLAFGRCERPFMIGFVEILDGLAASDRFFAFNVNAGEVLRAFGLPGQLDGLRALITELRAAADPEALLSDRMHASR